MKYIINFGGQNMKLKARVIFQSKNIYKVMLENTIYNARISGKFRHETDVKSDFPLVGDVVEGTLGSDIFLIESIEKRTSLLTREVAGSRRDVQGIAANIGTVFITTSLNMDFNINRLERYYAIVLDSGAKPVFVFTKTDLCSVEEINKYITQFTRVFASSSFVLTNYQENIYESLEKFLIPNEIHVFIGSSGVGKSTLINGILGFKHQKTKFIRTKDDRGRHETTNRQLFRIQNGSMLIDTPGMREINVYSVDSSVFEKSFKLIYDLAKQCQFTDCRHNTEPNCAVKLALMQGRLSDDLFESYRRMEREIRYIKFKEHYSALKEKGIKKKKHKTRQRIKSADLSDEIV